MVRLFLASMAVILMLGACSMGGGPRRLGADGLPLPDVYKIRSADRAQVEARMLTNLNAQRRALGVPLVIPSDPLRKSAAGHARDMARQDRPWHFGSDGSSPISRAARAGFAGQIIGEVISESYETELETLSAWMARQDTRGVLLDPKARRVGIAWHQQRDGKLWWVLLLGT